MNIVLIAVVIVCLASLVVIANQGWHRRRCTFQRDVPGSTLVWRCCLVHHHTCGHYYTRSRSD